MHKATILFTLLAMNLPAAIAQDKVVSPSPASSTTLELYDEPGAPQPVQKIQASEAGFPLPIQATQTGFFQVLVGGKEYWVRGAKVRVSRDTSANCGAVALSSGPLTAATPGAGKNACK